MRLFALYAKNKRVKLPDPLRGWVKMRNKKLKAAIAGGFYENEASIEALAGTSVRAGRARSYRNRGRRGAAGGKALETHALMSRSVRRVPH